jgi:hypothetical protein
METGRLRNLLPEWHLPSGVSMHPDSSLSRPVHLGVPVLTSLMKQHCRYEGEFSMGEMHGYGAYIWKDGT